MREFRHIFHNSSNRVVMSVETNDCSQDVVVGKQLLCRPLRDDGGERFFQGCRRVALDQRESEYVKYLFVCEVTGQWHGLLSVADVAAKATSQRCHRLETREFFTNCLGGCHGSSCIEIVVLLAQVLIAADDPIDVFVVSME